MPTLYDDVQYPRRNTGDWATYTCPRCSKDVYGAVIATAGDEDSSTITAWVRCPSCREGAVIVLRDEERDEGIYGPHRFGPDIVGLPQDVGSAYSESRSCMRVGAYTAAEVMCRKILMHIAVDKGAKEGQKFAAYLTYLESAGYVTPPMKAWVELIRRHGNVAAHDLPSTNRQRAESTVMFTAELLRLVYEMEYMAQQYSAKRV
jgi:DNA-directed RNA polymerase subunit RPC12/RpoP